ncbi:MAG: VWA domain-containing protein [Acidobacteriota bacterium]
MFIRFTQKSIPVFLFVIFAGSATVPGVNAQRVDDETVKVSTALVSVPVVVSDRSKRFIPGLTKADFRIFQDGVEQKIELFGSRDTPMNIVLALDTSVSTKPVLGRIKNAAREFVGGLADDDRCMIVTFDATIRRLNNLTRDKKVLDSAVKKATSGKTSGTMLNDTLYDAVNETLRPLTGRKAIVVLTDGKDYGSDRTVKILMGGLSESDTVIYPIFYETTEWAPERRPRLFGNLGRGNPKAEPSNATAKAFLQSLAEATGGRLFEPANGNVKEAFDQIADEMKRQYLIGFYPPEDAHGGPTHKIKVSVGRADAVVRAKAEYKTQTR